MLIEGLIINHQDQIDGNRIQTELYINSEHSIFEGHFPGNPVTPGVVLIQLFKEQAERFSGKKLQLQNASNIKFLSIVDPLKDNKVVVDAHLDEDEETIASKGQICVGHGEVAMRVKLIFKKI